MSNVEFGIGLRRLDSVAADARDAEALREGRNLRHFFRFRCDLHQKFLSQSRPLR